MTDPSGEKDRPASADQPATYEPPSTAEPAFYDPPATAEPAGYAPATADPASFGTADTTIGPDPTTAPDVADSTPPPLPQDAAPNPFAAPTAESPSAGLPPGSFETPAAQIPGMPYPGAPYQQAPGYPGAPYPAPQYGQPYPPPAPFGQPYPQPPRPQDNGLAIGALICSILGLCSCVTALAGLIMGHIALSKSNRGEAGGRGIALAAVITGYVVAALYIGFFTTFIILGTNGYLDR